MPENDTPADSSACHRDPLPRRYWRSMLLLALVVRGGMLLAQWPQLLADPDGYRALAQNLVQAGVYGEHDADTAAFEPEAFRPPLYPWLLAGCELLARGSVILVALLQLMLGAATVVVVLAVAWNLGLGRNSIWAAVLVLIDPLLLHHSTLVMTETLSALLVSLVLWIVTRRNWNESRLGWLLAGGCMGLAALCRPTFLLWIVLSALWLALGKDFRSRRWLRVAAFIAAAAVTLSPWVLRNWARFETPIVTTTHGGYTLHLANNPSLYAHLRSAARGTAWDGQVAMPSGDRRNFAEVQNELMRRELPGKPSFGERSLAADRWHYRQAWQAIRSEPWMFGYACIMRWGYLTQLAPHALAPQESFAQRAARYAIGLWYAGLYLLVARGAWSIGRRWLHQPWAWNLLLLLSFLLLHTFYWTNMRMRAPLMPILAITAAVGAGRKLNEAPFNPLPNSPAEGASKAA